MTTENYSYVGVLLTGLFVVKCSTFRSGRYVWDVYSRVGVWLVYQRFWSGVYGPWGSLFLFGVFSN